MPNRCVAAGCGNMPSDSISLFHFPKDPQFCAVFGPDKFNERGRIGNLLHRFCAANISVSIASTTFQR